jgi:hypothetical protein
VLCCCTLRLRQRTDIWLFLFIPPSSLACFAHDPSTNHPFAYLSTDFPFRFDLSTLNLWNFLLQLSRDEDNSHCSHDGPWFEGDLGYTFKQHYQASFNSLHLTTPAMDDKPGEAEAPDSSGPKIIRPIPRRPFKLNFSSPTPPEDDEDHLSPRPQISASDLRFLAPHQHTTTPSGGSRDGSTPLSHTTSYLNLTSPTLFGIYSPSTIASFTRDGDNDDQDQDPDQYFPDDDQEEGGPDMDREDILAAGTTDTPISTPSPQPGLDEETYELMRERSLHYPSTPLHPSRKRKRELALQLVLRAALLFVLGVGYGVLVTRLPQHSAIGSSSSSHHLHRLAGYEAHYQWRYLVFWGAAGVGLGSLLPWFDRFWEERGGSSSNTNTAELLTNGVSGKPGQRKAGDAKSSRRKGTKKARLTGPRPKAEEAGEQETVDAPVTEKPSTASAPQADWALVVRGIGAFVGIVFAIRRLPWASTMQVSLTLALANPFLWYLIDRSKPGFLLSAAVGLAGTVVVVVMGLDRDGGVVPAPGSEAWNGAGTGVAGGTIGGNTTGTSAGHGVYDGGLGGLASQETIETSIWMLSVLFCSCVCFGNIGRRLALNSSAAGRGRWGGVR